MSPESRGPPERRPSAFGDAPGPVVHELDRPQAADPVTLSVVADPHLTASERGTWKVFHRTEARLRAALDVARGGDADRRSADAVVFAGDQTRDGLRTEFDRFDEFLAGLDGPWAAVPGNHDVPKSFDDHGGLPVEAFRRRYVGGAEAVVSEGDAADAYPVVLRAGELRVVCLNSAAPPDVDLRGTWAGAVGPAQRERLRETLAAAPDDPTLVVCHHNLGALPEHESAYPWNRFPADDAPAVRDVLCEADVPLAVTGHHHVPAVRDHGTLTELMAPAVCSYPQAMLSLRVGPGGTTVRFVPLAGPAGIREAYWCATRGDEIGRGVLDMTTERLDRL
ncbi:MAG: metallophosphoesterase [Haloplanus sp.]